MQLCASENLAGCGKTQQCCHPERSEGSRSEYFQGNARFFVAAAPQNDSAFPQAPREHSGPGAFQGAVVQFEFIGAGTGRLLPSPNKSKKQAQGCLLLATIAIIAGAIGAHSMPIGVTAMIALVCIAIMAAKLK
jgi:hypothetical protein